MKPQKMRFRLLARFWRKKSECRALFNTRLALIGAPWQGQWMDQAAAQTKLKGGFIIFRKGSL